MLRDNFIIYLIFISFLMSLLELIYIFFTSYLFIYTDFSNLHTIRVEFQHIFNIFVNITFLSIKSLKIAKNKHFSRLLP